MLNKLRSRIRFSWGLKYKIIVLFTACTVLPLAIVGYFSYTRSLDNYRRFLGNYIEQTTAALNDRINTRFDNAIAILNIATDRRTQVFLGSRSEDGLYEASKNMGYLFVDTRNVTRSSQDIFDVTIIGANGNCVSERYGYFQLGGAFDDLPDVRTIREDPRSVFFLENPESLHSEPLETNLMSVASGVFRIGTNDLLGVIRIDILKSSIQRILADTQWSPDSLVTVISADGNPILRDNLGGFTPDGVARVLAQQKSSGNMTEMIHGVNYLIVYNTVPTVQWRLMAAVPLDTLLAPFYETGNAIVIAILFSLLIILLINILISTNLVRPIMGLKKLMKQASQGDFEVVSTYKGRDEISELYISFDKMVKKIKQLLESLLQERDNLKAYELKSLQSQINPHFLYNTLDSVVRVAESGKNDEVIDLIIALSHFYKAALGHGSDIVPLATELSHVENYLIIMKKRYHNILDYSIAVDERVLNARVPRIILQPIVENAIYHGIKNTRTGGTVRVAIGQTETGGTADQARVVFTIADDGIGMTADALDKLLQKINCPSAAACESIGLRNVNERLKLYFGRDCGLDIESASGQGTTVRICLPWIEATDGIRPA